MSELARRAVGRLLALSALVLGASLILRGVPGSGPQCLPTGGPGTELALHLDLLSPDPGCSHGSLAVTAAGLLIGAALLVALLLSAVRACSAARRVWLAAPSRTALLVLLLRRLTAPLVASAGVRANRIETEHPSPAPHWVPSLRLRRGPPAVVVPLPV